MAEVNINEKPYQVDPNVSLQETLEKNQFSLSGIAVAIDNAIIPKQEWSQTYLKGSENILIIKATQGG